MGCGTSKQDGPEPQSERRIRINDTPSPPTVTQTAPISSAAPQPAPRSAVIVVGTSLHESRMVEQENFVRSLSTEARQLIDATMANMLDLGHGSASPSYFEDRENLYQAMREDMPMAAPAMAALPLVPAPSLRLLTPEESQFMKETTNQLTSALKTVQVAGNPSIVQPFLPLPRY